MSHVVQNLRNYATVGFDPGLGALQTHMFGTPKANNFRSFIDPGNALGHKDVTPMPGPPNQDVAANAAREQADLLRRRRGVLANIYAGASSAGVAPAKANLGE